MALIDPNTNEYWKVCGINFETREIYFFVYENQEHRTKGDNAWKSKKVIIHKVNNVNKFIASPDSELNIVNNTKAACYDTLKLENRFKNFIDG